MSLLKEGARQPGRGNVLKGVRAVSARLTRGGVEASRPRGTGEVLGVTELGGPVTHRVSDAAQYSTVQHSTIEHSTLEHSTAYACHCMGM